MQNRHKHEETIPSIHNLMQEYGHLADESRWEEMLHF